MENKSAQIQIQGQQMLQTQGLSPLQVLVARLLQLTTVEMEERVRGEVIDNPALEEAPDVELVMSYDRRLLFTVGDQKYLDGPALIYDLDDEGDVMPVTAEDIFRVQQMLKRRTMMVTEEGEKMPVISLN